LREFEDTAARASLGVNACFIHAEEPNERLRRALCAEIAKIGGTAFARTTLLPFDPPMTRTKVIEAVNTYIDEVPKVRDLVVGKLVYDRHAAHRPLATSDAG